MLMEQRDAGSLDYTKYSRERNLIHDKVSLPELIDLAQNHLFIASLLLTTQSKNYSDLQIDLESIPKDIRDNFVPLSPYIHIGPHDLIDFAEHDDGHLLGRCNFCLSLEGHSTPHDWHEYRKIVFELPSVRRLKAFLEDLVGAPMQQVAYWFV